MFRRFAAVFLFAAAVLGTGAAAAAAGFVDLTRPGAIAELQRTNPAHFERIAEILEGLRREPRRAESDWLEVEFDARDVDLSRLLIRTSHPPKQSLTFTLDDTRYRLFVIRTDLVAEVVPVA
jgi:hypothetical protein